MSLLMHYRVSQHLSDATWVGQITALWHPERIYIFRNCTHLNYAYLSWKTNTAFCLLSRCFGPRISFGCESWKTSLGWNRGTGKGQRYGEGSVPFQQATFSQSHWSGNILSIFVLKLVAILWSQVQHSSECLTRVTILDSWKIGVKKNSSKIWPQSSPPSSNDIFKRSARLSFLPWGLLFEISLWI